MTGVKYVSFLDREGSGYSDAAKSYILGLDAVGVPVTWTPTNPEGQRGPLPYQPIECGAAGDPELQRFCGRDIPYDTVVVHMVPEYYPGWVEREPGKRMFGYTVWETDRVPRHWPVCLNAMDTIIVPCAWNKEVFEQGGVHVPIRVVPHAASPGTPIDQYPESNAGENDFVFYSINTWSPRKNTAALLEAYLSNFTRDDPVVLVLKTGTWDMTSPFLPILRRFLYTTKRSLRRTMSRYPNAARVELIADYLGEAQIRGMHQRGDCFVSLCHAEGWGMGAFDACLHGNPVIITGYGGQLEYLPAEAAYLVDYKMVPVDVAMGRESYSPDQHWAEPSIEHAGKLLRQAFENREGAKQRGEALREHVSTRFHSEVVARQFAEVLTGNTT
jgi:glycosyltransferase involved in cell wall biosynthesis